MSGKALPFVGPSYVYRNVAFDSQRSINLYPIRSETGTSRSEFALATTPGLQTFITVPQSPIRACRNVQGRGFVVAGNVLYEVSIDGVTTPRGTLLSSTGFVGMSDNGLQVIIVDGPYGYILELATNVFTQITSPNWRGSDTVTFLDGYFVLHQPDTQIYYISALYDGLTYDALDFASAEGSPDTIAAVLTVRQECWLFGRNTVQVVYNSGAADFPLAPIQGAFIEYGCAAPWSVAKTANSVLWLGQDADGDGVVWMATGYQPQRVSTHAIESQLRQLEAVSEATAYTYQEDGHYFYVLNVPGSTTTFVYDVTMQQWHERAYFSNGVYSRHKGNCHMFIYGRNLVGDYENGKIYAQDITFLDDDGQPIRRERVLPNYFNNRNTIYYNSFEIDIDAGNARASGAPEDTNPQIMLQFSNDGGRTWSSERWAPMGKVGEYRRRAIWRRLGRARERVFKVAYTARTKTILMAAYVDAAEASN